MEQLSVHPYDAAFKEFEESLEGSSEQDAIKAKWATAIIKQMNMIAWANKLYQDLKSETRFDHSILLKVLDLIYRNKRCDENQFSEYIELQLEIKLFEKNIAKWHDDEYSLPFGVDYFLLGMSMKFVNHDYLGILFDGYGKIYCDFYYGEQTLVDYTEKAVRLIKDVIGEDNYGEYFN